MLRGASSGRVHTNGGVEHQQVNDCTRLQEQVARFQPAARALQEKDVSLRGRTGPRKTVIKTVVRPGDRWRNLHLPRPPTQRPSEESGRSAYCR